MSTLSKILSFAVRNGVSDVHLRAGECPYFRRDGVLVTQPGTPKVSEEEPQAWLRELVGPEELAGLKADGDVDFAAVVEGAGRFRVSAYREQGRLALVLRHIPETVASVKDLGLPAKVSEMALSPRGLILVTGATGTGKTTTLAAMVQTINARRACHILTIEDPIEFTFANERAVISQRQVGTDTPNFARALRAGLRQDPDVILLGELRDLETAKTALQAAETGHLVLSTLHTTSAVETMLRLVSLFPPHQHMMVRAQLASVLKGVISQRLVPNREGGRVPACEILVQSELVKELIADPERLHELHDAIEAGGATYGMQSFDQSLLSLVKAGRIDGQEALAHATRPAVIQLALDGFG